MKKRPKDPAVPAERHETIRKQITTLLEGRILSVKEISPEIGISEKMAYDHLEHIKMKKGLKLNVKPAECRKCVYIFQKRERLKKPGKCPLCRGESIMEPKFSIS